MDVKLPNLGEGADSGAVVSILVKEGDTVEKGQTILELENEKAVAPIPSPAAGKVMKIKVKEGDKILVGQTILTLAESDVESGVEPPAEPRETEKAPPAETAPAVPDAESAPPPAAEEERDVIKEPGEPESGAELTPPTSPSIRKMARELGIDLSRIRGSEYGGRIVLKDVHDYIQRLQKIAFSPQPAAKRPALEQIDFAQWGSVERKKFSGLRSTIARRMTESWNAIPHVTQFDDADITGLSGLRKKWAPEYEKKGARLTLTPLILKAVVTALMKYPIFNSSLDEAAGEIVFKHYYHIGLAVDTEAGLIVPVIRDVDKKSVFDLANDVRQLAEKTRSRKITPDELKGGSFTISNQGGIGGAHFTPIINRPEVAILGLGRGGIKPVYSDGEFEPRTMLPLGLSYDHRLIDGADAARFITELVRNIEDFSEDGLKI